MGPGERRPADLLERRQCNALGHPVEIAGAGRPPPAGNIDPEQPAEMIMERAGARAGEIEAGFHRPCHRMAEPGRLRPIPKRPEAIEPLGPQETAQVGELVKQLKADGIGIFLISHDIHDVFDLADRVCVMKNGQVVGTARTGDVIKDEVLGMIILGKCPPGAVPGPGAMAMAA